MFEIIAKAATALRKVRDLVFRLISISSRDTHYFLTHLTRRVVRSKSPINDELFQVGENCMPIFQVDKHTPINFLIYKSILPLRSRYINRGLVFNGNSHIKYVTVSWANNFNHSNLPIDNIKGRKKISRSRAKERKACVQHDRKKFQKREKKFSLTRKLYDSNFMIPVCTLTTHYMHSVRTSCGTIVDCRNALPRAITLSLPPHSPPRWIFYM